MHIRLEEPSLIQRLITSDRPNQPARKTKICHTQKSCWFTFRLARNQRNMTATRGLWLLAIHLPMILSSPFELTEQYVADFAKGIEGLKKVAAETEFKEGVYDPSKYNETEALKGKAGTLQTASPRLHSGTLFFRSRRVRLYNSGLGSLGFGDSQPSDRNTGMEGPAPGSRRA